jgi:hypothetical protein
MQRAQGIFSTETNFNRYIHEACSLHTRNFEKNLGKLNVKLSFAHYSRELIISMFVITEFYCVCVCVYIYKSCTRYMPWRHKGGEEV